MGKICICPGKIYIIMHLKYLSKCSFYLFFLHFAFACALSHMGWQWDLMGSLPTEGPLQVVAPGPTWGHLYMFANVLLHLFLHGSSTPDHIPIYGGS